MTPITLHNTRTRRKEAFAPLDPANVRMYVCGPTVYDRAHLGNARPVVVFDVLYRLLRHVYGAGAVTYVRNFTDVDDKINARAREMQQAGDGRDLNTIIRALTDETIAWYHADMDALGALRPTHEPRATEYIGQMIAMIAVLVEKVSKTTGKPFAYVEQGHVLFDVRAYPEYGLLSGRSLDDMIAGARSEKAPNKRSPGDFVLWKPSNEDEPGWQSPWGRGRPGWHIECSAMADDLLWQKPLRDGRLSAEARANPHTFDIHGGGIDLQFPHHENEIAQSCCAHPDGEFARFWLHNEMVQVDGRKMSKSLGNFFTVRDLLDQGWPGEVIRFVMLSTHYRKPMDWTEEKAREAQAVLHRWRAQTRDVIPAEGPLEQVRKYIADDLNTPGAISELHQLAHAHDQPNLLASARLLGLLTSELGGWEAASPADGSDQSRLDDIERWLNAARSAAMESKDFSYVDRLKSALMRAGVEVRMTRDNVQLLPTAQFDSTLVWAIERDRDWERN